MSGSAVPDLSTDFLANSFSGRESARMDKRRGAGEVLGQPGPPWRPVLGAGAPGVDVGDS